MCDAGTKVRDFMADLNTWQEAWRTWAVRPYSMAWRTACRTFKETVKSQRELEQKRLELGLTALSICGGGILTAVFADAALKNAAHSVVLDVICKNNLERAFTVAYKIEKSKTASFIVGALWDEAQTRLTAGLKASLEPTAAQFPAINTFLQSNSDDNLPDALHQFVGEARLKLDAIAVWLRDHARLIDGTKLTDQQKIAILEQLRRAPFCSPPSETIDDGRLAERIELAFYMNMVLDSDSLVISNVTATGHSADIPWPTTQSTKITRMPSSGHYPKESRQAMRDRGQIWSSQTSIVYDKIGSKIVERMEALYPRNGFGNKFFLTDADLLGNQAPNRETLIRAEHTLQRMANMGIRPVDALTPQRPR
jgi:hypothetical protein